MIDFKDSSTFSAIAIGSAVIIISILGGVARMLQDVPGSHVKLTWLDWAKYCSASLLAGIILAAITHHYYGLSPMLLATSGLGGFGSVQLLAFGTELVKKLGEKITGVNVKRK